jgi:autophagy-related protein 18
MLFTTNLVLLVGQTDFGDFSPRRVTIWSTKENCVICSSWPFTNKISIAKINKKRMVVLERNFLHFYSIEDMKILHSIEVGNVGASKFSLSPSEKNNFLCFSSSTDEGIVKVYDILFFTFKSSFQAHKSEIMRMTINNKGELLATCSCKGTIIRIFSLPKGEKVLTFKRGISSANIFSMNFSSDNEKFISSSDTGTIHVFDLKKQECNE